MRHRVRNGSDAGASNEQGQAQHERSSSPPTGTSATCSPARTRSRACPTSAATSAASPRYFDEHEVDVLAIAGDVFEAQDRGAARAAASGDDGGARRRRWRAACASSPSPATTTATTSSRRPTSGSARRPAAAERIICARARARDGRGRRRARELRAAAVPDGRPLRPRDTTTRAASPRATNCSRSSSSRRWRSCASRRRSMRLPTVLLTHVTVAGTNVKAAPHLARATTSSCRARISRRSSSPSSATSTSRSRSAAATSTTSACSTAWTWASATTSRACCSPTSARRACARSTSLPLDPTPFAVSRRRDEDEMAAAARDASTASTTRS